VHRNYSVEKTFEGEVREIYDSRVNSLKSRPDSLLNPACTFERGRTNILSVSFISLSFFVCLNNDIMGILAMTLKNKEWEERTDGFLTERSFSRIAKTFIFDNFTQKRDHLLFLFVLL